MEVYRKNVNPVYINSDSFVIEANMMGNPDLVQIRCSLSCRAVISDPVNFPTDKRNGYPQFRISQGNIHLALGNVTYNIYLGVPRQGGTALVGFSPVAINVSGRDSSGRMVGSELYCYYPIGTIGVYGTDTSVISNGRKVTVNPGVPHIPDVAYRAVDTVEIGRYNLLLNSGFTGLRVSRSLSAGTRLETSSDMFSPSLEGWSFENVLVAEDAKSRSGYSVQLGSDTEMGYISQRLQSPLVEGESYVLSFKAKGTALDCSFGQVSKNFRLTDTLQRYVFKARAIGPSQTFDIHSSSCVLCEVQLERGTVPSDWGLNINDGTKDTGRFEDMQYVLDAIRQGDTKTLGGVILSSIIMLGKQQHGSLTEVNAGISGVCSDSDDVALWAGGSMEQAVKTIMRFRDNPNKMPSEEEWNNLCSWVVSHGGDTFMRGYIYALGGIFKGKVSIADGRILLDEDGSGKVAGGNRWWNADGTMFTKVHDIIRWVSVMDSIKDPFQASAVHNLDYKKGTYVHLDLPSTIGNNVVNLPVPDYDMQLSVSAEKNNRQFYRAVLKGAFRYFDASSRTYKSSDKLSIAPASVGVVGNLIYNSRMNCWLVQTERCSLANDILLIE